MLVSELIAEVAEQLVDKNYARWSQDELLKYMNMGIQTFILKRPDLTKKIETVATSSNTLDLPADGYEFISVNHVDSHATQYADINRLNQLYPTWRTQTGAPVIWTKNDFDNKTIYLYPAPSVEVSVEYVYSANLTASSTADDFPIPDIYKSIIFDYMVYRAYDKDGENASEAQKAQNHLLSFATAIGDKATADQISKQWLQEQEKGR